MFTPMHRGLGWDPSDLTWELLQACVDERVRESDDLDWKSTLPQRTGDRWQGEFAKDVAAMANSGGGWLVYGVGEDRKTSEARDLVGVGDENQQIEQALMQVAASSVRPAVTGVRVHWITGARTVLALHVLASVDVPHLVYREQHSFAAPRRHAAMTTWMTERDIELAYRERFRGQADRLAALEDLFEEQVRYASRLQGAELPRDAVSLVAAAVPVEHRGASPVAMAPTVAQQVLWEAHELYAGILDVESDHVYDVNVQPGLRRFTSAGRPQDGEVCSVHFDGSVSLNDLVSRGRVIGGYGGQAMPGSNVERAVARLLALVAATSRGFGVSGPHVIRAGLVWITGEPLRFAAEHPHLRGQYRLLEPPRMVYEVRPTSTEVFGDADISGLRAMARVVALDLLHQGGLSELRLLPGRGFLASSVKRASHPTLGSPRATGSR